MKILNMNNGIKVLYEYRQNYITSFCIGFKAGALMESKEELGLAHVVEHMIFKGTKTRSEIKINRALDEIFGFNNAMTNFPYSIYYGTTLSENFEKGFEIYSDIILNPIFPKEGFSEEIDIICEELREWKDDNFQLCEDELLKNAFKSRRINTCIIGEEKSIRKISIENIKSFYEKFYVPTNCVISVVSSLDYESVKNIVTKYFENWSGDIVHLKQEIYEKNDEGKFIKNKEGIQGAKIQYCFPIHDLDDKEVVALKIFNTKFGEGTSSILYDKIRTQNGLAYDIYSYIKNESGIKLFIICLGTSNGNVEKAMGIINNLLSSSKELENIFTKDDIIKAISAIKLKRELRVEKSIELCKELTTNEIMFGEQKINNEQKILQDINAQDIIKIIKKVLVSPTIQVLCH
ncbi:M16 family metallopeptidase [Clostridium akagii]|uniref:M16 family metallopeptidase n=1 Tax=Clostridium akagii TaxID=91623 RepID=UPI00047E88CF|nr:pitrilysin family protein [Clostridium akagii]